MTTQADIDEAVEYFNARFEEPFSPYKGSVYGQRLLTLIRASQATKTNCGECERLMAALEEIALDAGDSVHGRNGNLAKEALASCQERK
jgi:hypothetical protein